MARVRRVAYLAVPLAIAAILRLYDLTAVGFGNQYYAATVKSMTTSIAAFLYGSFDPGLFVTVDKPAPGLWPQAIAAALFGFTPLALFLPQAIAGIASVAVLGRIVARDHGPFAGGLAALALAVAPIAVAVDRNNTMDAVLVLVLLFAVWCTLRSLREGWPWLFAAAVLVGVGFNLKMAQAFVVLPALVLTYAIAAPARLWARALHLIGFAALTLAVSSLWIAFVDLTPADSRPYVGGSGDDNTALALAIGHNGLARVPQELLFWIRPQQPAGPPPGGTPPAGGPTPLTPAPFIAPEVGERGPLRLLNDQLAGQVTWYIPVALAGAATVLLRRRWPLDGAAASALLWLAWIVPTAILFSWSGLFHRYYLVMLAPPLAALVGAGIAALIARARTDAAWRIVAVATAALTAALHVAIVQRAGAYASWLVPVAIAGLMACLVAIAIARMRDATTARLSNMAIAFAIASLFAAPLVWAATTLDGADAGLPFAGPELLSGSAQRITTPIGQPVAPRSPLLDFLVSEHRGERWIAATSTAQAAAPLMLRADVAVMTLGGFSGGDPILDAQALEAFVRSGDVRFVLIADRMRMDLDRWVRQRCIAVPPERFGGRAGPVPPGPLAPAVFDCMRVRES